MVSPRLLGIVNITDDSFSDGGRFLDQHAAISQADNLLEAGADVIDLGAVASNPDSIRIPVRVEIERLDISECTERYLMVQDSGERRRHRPPRAPSSVLQALGTLYGSFRRLACVSLADVPRIPGGYEARIERQAAHGPLIVYHKGGCTKPLRGSSVN